ncbi:unnamed protein product, partial [Ectocarpus sp. 13 AM-2016]
CCGRWASSSFGRGSLRRHDVSAGDIGVLARPAASRSLVRREDVFRRADEEGV